MKVKTRLFTLGTIFLFIGIFYKFLSSVATYISGSIFNTQYDLLSFLMPLVVAIAAVGLLLQRRIQNLTVIAGFVLMFYGILITVVNQRYGLTQLPFLFINMTYWLASLYLVYNFRRDRDKVIWPVNLMFILVVICFVAYILTIQTAKSMAYYQTRDVLLNSIYYILFAFPFTLLSRKKYIQNIAWVIVFVATILSSKRGALIILFCAWLVWMFLQLGDRKKRVGRILLYAILCVAVYFAFIEITRIFEINILERLQNIQNDGGSGRFEIWEDTLKIIAGEDFLISLMGRGYRAASIGGYTISESHNDFLQILFDYGYIGLVLFLIFCFTLIRQFILMTKNKYDNTVPYAVSLVIFFGCAMISQTILYPYWFIGISSFWGFVLGDFDNQKIEG